MHNSRKQNVPDEQWPRRSAHDRKRNASDALKLSVPDGQKSSARAAKKPNACGNC